MLLFAAYTHSGCSQVFVSASGFIVVPPKDCAVRAKVGFRICAWANSVAFARIDAHFYECFFRNLACWEIEAISRVTPVCHIFVVSVFFFFTVVRHWGGARGSDRSKHGGFHRSTSEVICVFKPFMGAAESLGLSPSLLFASTECVQR